MANHKSAKKRNRQAIVARMRNKAATTKARSIIKKLRLAIENKDKATASELLVQAQSSLGKLSKTPAMKKNTAARRTGRLASQVAKL